MVNPQEKIHGWFSGLTPRVQGLFLGLFAWSFFEVRIPWLPSMITFLAYCYVAVPLLYALKTPTSVQDERWDKKRRQIAKEG